MSCGAGHRYGQDLVLLWLWGRPVASAMIWPLAWQPPYATGVALKKTFSNKTESLLFLKGCTQQSDTCLWVLQELVTYRHEGWNDDVDPPDFHQLKLGLWWPLLQSYASTPLLQPLHEYAGAICLQFPQFCCSGRHCFGKYPRYSLYLLQIINAFFWFLGLVFFFGSIPSKRGIQLSGNLLVYQWVKINTYILLCMYYSPLNGFDNNKKLEFYWLEL